MVMFHYMIGQRGSGNLAVAHCNFQLRGNESEKDEQFVFSICQKYGVECYSDRFQTQDYAREHGIGIQEAARDQRYDWFFKLKKDNRFDFIATAHHLDDSIETFFINLLRGSGPRGLSGIQNDETRGLIRPLIKWSKKDIEDYAERHQLKWREDSSNASVKYMRNQIRHQIIPKLNEIRPGFGGVMQRNMLIQREISSMLESQAQKYRSQCFLQEGDHIRIVLDEREGQRLLLRIALAEYGFSDTQLDNILTSIQSGKQVISSSHVLTSYQSGFLLNELKEFPSGPWVIEESLDVSHLPIDMEITLLDSPPEQFYPDPNVAHLDIDSLRFPLMIRRWRDGDRFCPLGMKGEKKVSDFLVDEKVPLQEKKKTLVLESDGVIVWIVGHRISERFKVSSDEKKVLFIRV
jgi:tRNA(Ile)-lysidine synthase